jgi:hypothetical protein
MRCASRASPPAATAMSPADQLHLACAPEYRATWSCLTLPENAPVAFVSSVLVALLEMDDSDPKQ